MGAHPGSLGAVTATRKNADIKAFADEALRNACDMKTGANEDGFHLRHVSIERDIKVTQWFDLADGHRRGTLPPGAPNR